jgi:uncharacterized protein YeaC (DUF1315 family)
MSFDEVLQSLTPEIIVSFRQALELGKWPDGRLMTTEQKALCMEAVLKYEAIHQVPEAERLGYIDRSGLEKRRNQLKTSTNLIKLMKGEE